MHNALQGPEDLSSLLQVGIRDLCEQEHDAIQSDPRIKAIFGHELRAARHGSGTRAMARAAVADLPRHALPPLSLPRVVFPGASSGGHLPVAARGSILARRRPHGERPHTKSL